MIEWRRETNPNRATHIGDYHVEQVIDVGSNG